MKISVYSLLALLALSLCGCKDSNDNDPVVSQQYIHKYGYALSQAEWDEKDYPGQVITHLRNGVVVMATYENGVLHGPVTYTFPHSQTVEHHYLYNQGTKVKEILYNISGMPLSERIQLSPSRYSVTQWYNEGTPMHIEDFVGDELLEGQYFTVNNDLESRIEKGHGLRVLRNGKGTLSSKETYEEGYAIKKETFYPSGSPESIAYYRQGELNGEKKTFAPTGEPVAVEEYVNNQLHGKATYYDKGNKYLEVSYLIGEKHGVERHFVDGEILSEEICYENDKLHGPATYYFGEKPHQEWYYAGEKVSRSKFKELNSMDEMVSQISPLYLP